MIRGSMGMQRRVLCERPCGDRKVDYTHYNPVDAGLVENPHEYLYSSARDYCDIKGLVN
jgi:hypothetical protein